MKHNFKIGQKVKAKVWPKAVTGVITDVFDNTVFINIYDEAGRALCVNVSALTPVPEHVKLSKTYLN